MELNVDKFYNLLECDDLSDLKILKILFRKENEYKKKT